MNVMEFDELKKIWDNQNNQIMYAIDEAALHRRIKAKRDHARLVTNVNEIGLLVVAVATGIILLIIGKGTFFTYLSVGAIWMVGLYVLWGRIQRQKRSKHFEQSMLGDLEEAISNIDNEIKRARTFVWWFLVPALLPALLNIAQAGGPWWKWLIVPVTVILSVPLVQWEMRRKHIPRRKHLEKLREKLLQNPADQLQV